MAVGGEGSHGAGDMHGEGTCHHTHTSVAVGCVGSWSISGTEALEVHFVKCLVTSCCPFTRSSVLLGWGENAVVIFILNAKKI